MAFITEDNPEIVDARKELEAMKRKLGILYQISLDAAFIKLIGN